MICVKNGFAVVYSDFIYLYVRFYDNNCNALTEKILINNENYIHTHDKNFIYLYESEQYYIFTWISGNEYGNGSYVYSRKLDKNYNMIDEQYIISDNPNYYKIDSKIINTDFGYIVCWNLWNSGSTIYVKKFDNNGNQIDEIIKINNDVIPEVIYFKVIKNQNGYLFLLCNESKFYIQQVDFNFSQIDSLYTIINDNHLNKYIDIGCYDNKFVISYTRSNSSYLQYFNNNCEKENEEVEITSALNSVNGNPKILNINNGYLISWMSNSIDSYDIFIDIITFETNNNETNEDILLNFINNINNLLTDIDDIENIKNQISEWITSGIKLESCIDPLNQQNIEWNEKINFILTEFKNNFLELKQFDDRIQNSTELIFNEEEYNNKTITDKTTYLTTLYTQLNNNLEEDLLKLQEVTETINNYKNIGIVLGNAIEEIEKQINDIQCGIENSKTNLNNIILQSEQDKETVKITN